MKTKIKILAVLSIALFGLFAFKSIESKKIIVIDAAHGGKDLGASIGGVHEKDIVEAISKKIKAQNQDENIEIFLLREGDHFMELSERVSIINNLKPTLVISLHADASKNVNINGVGAYIFSDKTFYDQSKSSAESVIENLSTENLAKGEVKEASFYVLKNSKCPAVLLEMGYLSNEKDRNYLKSESGQNKIADKILEAIK
jgi:N-acetylmuramoyl-L-alanine amidase